MGDANPLTSNRDDSPSRDLRTITVKYLVQQLDTSRCRDIRESDKTGMTGAFRIYQLTEIRVDSYKYASLDSAH